MNNLLSQVFHSNHRQAASHFQKFQVAWREFSDFSDCKSKLSILLMAKIVDDASSAGKLCNLCINNKLTDSSLKKTLFETTAAFHESAYRKKAFWAKIEPVQLQQQATDSDQPVNESPNCLNQCCQLAGSPAQLGCYFRGHAGNILVLRFSAVWVSCIKVHALFGLFLLNIFLSESIVFLNFAEVVWFVLSWSNVIAIF